MCVCVGVYVCGTVSTTLWINSGRNFICCGAAPQFIPLEWGCRARAHVVVRPINFMDAQKTKNIFKKLVMPSSLSLTRDILINFCCLRKMQIKRVHLTHDHVSCAGLRWASKIVCKVAVVPKWFRNFDSLNILGKVLNRRLFDELYSIINYSRTLTENRNTGATKNAENIILTMKWAECRLTAIYC